MAINTGSFGLALWPGINKWYGEEYNEFKTQWTDVFTKYSSRKAWEEDVLFSALGLAQIKGEGAPVTYDTMQQGFVDRYTHVEYASGFIITKVMVEDDLYDIIGNKKAKALGYIARQTKEVVASNVLARAWNSSFTYGDGVSLLNTAHKFQAGGTWQNTPTASVQLSETALEQAYIDISKYTDDRGSRIMVKPQKLIVPTDLDFEANKIMRTEYQVDSNNNTVNLVRSRFPEGVFVNNYLTNTTQWYIITDVQDGMKYFERRADTFTFDDDFDTDNAKYKFTTRYSFGASDKRAIYGSGN